MKSKINQKNINKINEKNIKAILYSIIKFGFSFVSGVLLYIFLSDHLPLQLIKHITSLFNSHDISNELIIFIYEIIVNSVDIFKISFIIILSGLTYVHGIISNLCIAVSGLFYGFSATLCICSLMKTSVLSECYFEIFLLVLKIFIFSFAVVYCFVTSIKVHESLKYQSNCCEYRLLSNYLFSTLVLFGYIIIFEVLFRFAYKIFY